MPPGGGTFVGVNAVVGSTDTTNTTTIILALYSDNGGLPGTLLFSTDYSNPVFTFNNPSGLMTMSSASGGGSYVNGFTGQLSGNTSYWAYLKAGTICPTQAISALSSAPCVTAGWINVAAPNNWINPQGACPSSLNLYVVATFP
jgi:hypothetical protein